MGPRVEGWSEEEAKPPQAELGVKDMSLKVHREPAGGLILPGSPLVDEFCFGNRKRGVALGCSASEGGEGLLEEADVRAVGGGCSFCRRPMFVL